GAAFATDPSFKFPPELAHLERNANGAGLSTYQLAQNGSVFPVNPVLVLVHILTSDMVAHCQVRKFLMNIWLDY
ncbi:hypothetical protein, partial [Acinetobacter baumannii]|uniref:hypothetical protein n=1 Tax=Acinetobacter baumannii TaxID=470 RepID=UPI002B23C133